MSGRQGEDDVLVYFGRRRGKADEVVFQVPAQHMLSELVVGAGARHNVKRSVVQFHFALVVQVGQVHKLGNGQAHSGAGLGRSDGQRSHMSSLLGQLCLLL